MFDQMVTDERNTNILRCTTYRPINLATELLHSRRWSRGFYILLSFTFFTFLKKCADYLAMWIFCVNTHTHFSRAYYTDYLLNTKELAKKLSLIFTCFSQVVFTASRIICLLRLLTEESLVIYIGDILSTRLYTEYRRCMFSRI